MIKPMRENSIRATWAFIGICVIAVCARAQTPSPSPSPAANPPASDIFVIDIIKHHDFKTRADTLKFGDPKKITEVAGYNNQPFFTPDGKTILYTSIRNKQADIYLYDIQTGVTAQVTNTAESEYSPTLMPDRKNISVIRVEADGKTQRLWKFPPAGGAPSLIIEDIKGVGYHLWIDDHTLALFIVGGGGKPNYLEIYDTRTAKSEFVTDNPGRVMRLIPNQNKFSFVQKISKDQWEIKAFDLRTHTSAPLISTLAGSEDYAWLPDGRLLMGQDSKLFVVVPLSGQKWTQVEDFAVPGLQGISRLAVSPKGDRLAVVVRHAN
jgi:Tol biopolymer transport system component